MDGWGITNVNEGFVIEAGNTIAVKARDVIADTEEALYWVAPNEYLGNKVGPNPLFLATGFVYVEMKSQSFFLLLKILKYQRQPSQTAVQKLLLDLSGLRLTTSYLDTCHTNLTFVCSSGNLWVKKILKNHFCEAGDVFILFYFGAG
jgi:hypothetical protein